MPVDAVSATGGKSQVVFHVVVGHFPHPQVAVYIVVIEHESEVRVRPEIIQVGGVVHYSAVSAVTPAFAFAEPGVIQVGDIDVGDMASVGPVEIPGIAAPGAQV